MTEFEYSVVRVEVAVGLRGGCMLLRVLPVWLEDFVLFVVRVWLLLGTSTHLKVKNANDLTVKDVITEREIDKEMEQGN